MNHVVAAADSLFASLLADAAAKSLVVFALAGMALWLLRRAGFGAGARHLVCVGAFGALLVLPLLSFVLPAGWRVLVAVPRPAPAAAAAASPARTTVSLPPAGGPYAQRGPATPPVPLSAVPFRDASHSSVSLEPADAAGALLPPARTPRSLALRPTVLLVTVWLAGALFAAGRLAFGLMLTRRWLYCSRPVGDTEPAAQAAGTAARTLGFAERHRTPQVRVGVREPAASLPPLTWGWRRPVILLPAASEAWDGERLRVVLLHEIAHVARGDWGARMLAGVVCALYWFHPLAWLFSARLQAESEAACDERVLESGVCAPDYAAHLVAVARTLRDGCRTARFAPAMATSARPSVIEARLRSILAWNASSSRARLSRRGLALGAVFAALALLALAALRPVARAQQQAPTAPGGSARSNEDRRAKQIACLTNLKRIGTALMMYTQDYDEHLPPMNSPAAFQNRVRPYVSQILRQERGEKSGTSNDSQQVRQYWARQAQPTFTCPETGTQYLPVAALGKKSRVHIAHPAFTAALCDAAPHQLSGTSSDRLWNVVYADGHVKAERTLPGWTPRPITQDFSAAPDQERLAKQTGCQSNLKQVATALMMYVQDYDETYPPLASTAQMQNRLRPYLRNNAAFSCPETRLAYRPTPALGELRLETLPAPDKITAIRDAAPHPGFGYPGNRYENGTWNIAYADGHVKAEIRLPTVPDLSRARTQSVAAQRYYWSRNRRPEQRQRRSEQNGDTARRGLLREFVIASERGLQQARSRRPFPNRGEVVGWQSRLYEARQRLSAFEATQARRGAVEQTLLPPAPATRAEAQVAQAAAEVAAAQATIETIRRFQRQAARGETNAQRLRNEEVRRALFGQEAKARFRLAEARAQLAQAQIQRQQTDQLRVQQSATADQGADLQAKQAQIVRLQARLAAAQAEMESLRARLAQTRAEAAPVRAKQQFIQQIRNGNVLRPLVFRAYTASFRNGNAGRLPADQLAPDFTYRRRDGTVLDRAGYLAESRQQAAAGRTASPLALSVQGSKAEAHGAFSILVNRSYREHGTGEAGGSQTTALTTLDTWVQTPGGWRLRRSEEQPQPRSSTAPR